MRPMFEARGAQRRQPKAVIRGMLGTSVAIAGAIVIAASISASSYALWNDSDASAAASVSSGTVGLTATGPFTAASWSNLLPGEKVRQPFTVSNTGSVALDLSGTAVTGTTDFEVRAVRGACPATDIAGASATTSAVSLGTLAAGASATVCLEVTLATTASPGATSNWVLTVSGTQVP